MICSHGTHTALYVVNGVGYCKSQYEEAKAATAALGKRRTGRDYDSWTPEEKARRVVEEKR